jgi:hypothetical protein
MPSSPEPASRFLASEAELRAAIEAPHARILQKILSKLDPTSQRWVANAALVALAVPRADGSIDVVARAASAGRMRSPDERTIRIPDELESHVGRGAERIEHGIRAGALFAVPGIAETLRANGPLRRVGSALELEVAETYLHCAKAFVRSNLWVERKAHPSEPPVALEAEHAAPLGPHARVFISRSPFVVLGTGMRGGGCDASPRGDPAGFVQILDERTLLLPDRPGNRIVDSFRNIVANPVAGLLFLIPGCPWALRVRAVAHLTDDPARLARCEVAGKRPKLGVWLDVRESVLERAPALIRSGLFDSRPADAARVLPTLGEAITDQLAPRGRFKGVRSALTDWALRQDTKRNLY